MADTLQDGEEFAKAILETVELPLLALDGDFRVDVVNEAFLRHFQVGREAVVGRRVYELGDGQWDIPELRRLFDEVLASDSEVKHYRVEHIFDRIGRRIMRLNAKRIVRSDASDAVLLAITDDTERERLQSELEGRIEFADKLIDSVRESLLVIGRDLRVRSANQPFYDLFGVERSETEGRLIYELGNGQWNIPALRTLLDDVLPREQSFDDYEVRHTFDGIGKRVMLLNGRRLDHLDLIVLAIRDVTHRARREEHVHLLMREINHRSKNLLGLVQAIAHQTVSPDRAEFLVRFEERLQSLAASQDLLVQHVWKAIPLADLVYSQVMPFKDLIGSRLVYDGPPLQLTPNATQTIGMALHELATNAVKHGALSTDAGRIDIGWCIESGEGGDTFVMTWQEAGGPPVKVPQRHGFGTSVTSSMVEWSLGGAVTLDFAPSGLFWKLVTSAKKVLNDGHAAESPGRIPGSAEVASKTRVLVVEDEALLAVDIAAMLEGAGYKVVGPVGNASAALSLIDENGCDAALLDITLRNETSESVANRLEALAIPFLVVTGYSHSQLPAAYRGAPAISKPLRRALLLSELERLLPSAADGT
ncbi:MAG: HWE histidine kinase domain-containing protein [Hyphomicrobiaceae bacterium]